MKFNLSILVLIFLLLIPFTPRAQQPLPPAEFQKAIAHPDVLVLDVRTAAEYGTGHLDSVFLADWNARPDFIRRVSSLNKSKPLYVYCLSGGRSTQAAEWLQKEGFNTYTLAGGINAWKKQGLPLANEVMVPQVSFADFKKSLPSKGTVLVDVGADWCPPCHQMNPVLDSLVKTDGQHFSLVRVNGAQQMELGKALLVNAFPTFIIYKDGRETWRKEGLVDAAELVQQF